MANLVPLSYRQLPTDARKYAVRGFLSCAPSGLAPYRLTIPYNSSSPVNLLNVIHTSFIAKIEIDVTAAFNGSASIAVGVAGSTSLLAPASETKLNKVALTSFEVHAELSPVQIIATYTQGGATQGSLDIIVWAAEQPRAKVTYAHIFECSAMFLAGLSGSYANPGDYPKANTILTIAKVTGGVSSPVGTITFQTAGNAPLFSFTSDVTFNTGDRLEVSVPANLNYLADASFVLVGMAL